MPAYPSTTNYLTRKLNWMARKLRCIDDPSSIKDWTEAMNCVFKILEAFSGNKELTTPTERTRRKLDIYRADSTNFISREEVDQPLTMIVAPKETKNTSSIMEVEIESDTDRQQSLQNAPFSQLQPAKRRAVIRGIRMRKAHRIDESERESMGRNTDAGRFRAEANIKSKVKDWWTKALWRRLKLESKDNGHWDDKDKFTKLLELCSTDGEMKEKFKENFPSKPAVESIEFYIDAELYKNLRIELDKFYQQ